jgi:hypothetical protein
MKDASVYKSMETIIRYIAAGLSLLISIGFAIYKWITVDGGSAAGVLVLGLVIVILLLRPEDERRMGNHAKRKLK